MAGELLGGLLDHLGNWRASGWLPTSRGSRPPEGPHMQEYLDLLDRRATRGYGPRPIPDPLDGEVGRLVRAFMDSTPEQRQRLQTALTERHANTLGAYAERMASWAVRIADERYLVLGLVAATLALESGGDWRDHLHVLSLLHRSAEKLGLAPASVFQRAGEYVGQAGGRWLMEFLRRSDRDREIWVMGYDEGSDADGFRYQRVKGDSTLWTAEQWETFLSRKRGERAD